MKPETRTAVLSDLRASGTASAANRRTVSGRAIVYGAMSLDLGGFRETFRPGSVRLVDDLRILFGHDTSKVLGRTTAGTARAFDDGKGIAFEVELPDTTYARDLSALIERGDVTQCSFAFVCRDDTFYFNDTYGTVVREVIDAEVSELSIVAMPAYEATTATIT